MTSWPGDSRQEPVIPARRRVPDGPRDRVFRAVRSRPRRRTTASAGRVITAAGGPPSPRAVAAARGPPPRGGSVPLSGERRRLIQPCAQPSPIAWPSRPTTVTHRSTGAAQRRRSAPGSRPRPSARTPLPRRASATLQDRHQGNGHVDPRRQGCPAAADRPRGGRQGARPRGHPGDAAHVARAARWRIGRGIPAGEPPTGIAHGNCPPRGRPLAVPPGCLLEISLAGLGLAAGCGGHAVPAQQEVEGRHGRAAHPACR